MSRILLNRIGSFQNVATTNVVAASRANKFIPMIELAEDHDHHDDHAQIALPNGFKPSTSNSFNHLLAGGSLRVTNSFTSKRRQPII